MKDFSDEELMRFADGELDDERSAAIEAALAVDEDVATRLAVFMDTRSQAKAALAPMLDEPVPAALTQSVEAMIARHKAQQPDQAEQPNVVAFKPRQRIVNDWRLLPIAASITAILGGVAGYAIGGAGEPQGGGNLVLGPISNPEVVRLLGELPSGQEAQLAGMNTRMRSIASFSDGGGELCREFELDPQDAETIVSVACWSENAWTARFAVAAPAQESGYAPASSMESVEAYLAAIGATETLSADAERERLAQLK